MDVHISANAFWALLISAIEVYKKECYGMVPRLSRQQQQLHRRTCHFVSNRAAPARQRREKSSRIETDSQVSR
jgi:hypothetical protein